MPDLPSLDLGAASGGAREYDAQVAANPDYNSVYSSVDAAEAGADETIQTGPMANYKLLLAGTNYVAGGDTMTGADATANFGVKGPTPETSLSWAPDQTVSREQAYLAQQMTLTRSRDEWITSRRPQTWTGWSANMAGDVLGSAVDPVNIAASFLPLGIFGDGAATVLKAAKLTDAAAAVTRMSQAIEASTAGRIGMATLNNSAAVALTQPLIMAGAQADHYDYTFGQAAQNILFGGLIGGGFHTLGELIDAGFGHGAAPTESDNGGPITFDALQDGSTARGMMRAGVASMDSTHSLSPEAAQDMLAASRPQVTADLTEQLNRPPTEDEISALIEQRSQDFMDNKAAGKYDPAIEPLEPIDASHATPEAIQQAIDQGDYETASKLAEQHVSALEQDPAFKLSDDDRAEANKPVEELSTIQKMMQDFTACVAQEAD